MARHSTHRYNRQWIAWLAIETLVPRVHKDGAHHFATPDGPSHRRLALRGLEITLAENVLLQPEAASLVTQLDGWAGVGARKVLNVSWEPLEIGSFHGGDWVDVLVELSLEGKPPPAIGEGAKQP